MKEHPSLYTNNSWIFGKGSFFSSKNPASGEIVWEGKESAPTQVNEAISNATKAFHHWSLLPIDERTNYLIKFSECLKEAQYSLAEAFSKETGKPLWDSLNEVNAMVGKVQISLESYGKRCSALIKNQSSGRLITRHRPHGVVAVFGPYNFPGHLPNGHIIPALLAGNTVVFKPSELTPYSAEKMIECWEKVNLPPGVLNVVQGGHVTGEALYRHKGIQGLFFTGSCQTGLLLSSFFANDPSKILALEMGGNNPLIIDEIDDVKAACYYTIQSAFLTAGQRCTCARRLILCESPQTKDFLTQLITMIHSLSIGPFTEIPEPFMGPVISETHALRLLDFQKELIAKGGIPLVEMRHMKEGTGFVTPGLIDVTTVKERFDGEIFGPLLQVIRTTTFAEAIEEANNTKFGLSAGLFSNNHEHYQEFLHKIKAGIINWNAPLTGASSAAPFGGIKGSGNHRPSAFYAADYCSYPTASIELTELKIPPLLTPGVIL